MKQLLALFAVLLFGTGMLSAQDITATWYGNPDLGGRRMRINFRFTETNGAYSGAMQSPDQSGQWVPFEAVTFDGGVLKTTIPAIGFTYEGRPEGGRLVGAFTQMGRTFPLEMTREEIDLNRPQEPKPKYPYDIAGVTFRNEEAGITLAGTLTVPWGKGSFPAVILISGSGPQNRDSELFQHKPFWIIADRLVQQGIAVLRYDDRGVGDSEGVYATATFDDFASDASSALAWLKNQPKIDASKAGAIGHSEGGAIVLMLAAEHEPAFIVSLAGPGIVGLDVSVQQGIAMMRAYGASEEDAIQYGQMNERIMQEMLKFEDPAERRQHITALLAGTPLAGQEDALLSQLTPEIVSLLRFDPAAYYPRIECPVLALNGEKDVQVVASPNLEGIRSGITANGNDRVTVKAYLGLNHLFQPAETGLPTEYGEIEITFSGEVIQDIADWILVQ